MSAVHARKCQYIKVNGLQCGSPALRGHQHCYFHYDIRRTTLNTVLPILEDATAIQAALDNLATWIIEKRLDPLQINQLLWLMKIAAFNAPKARIDTVFKERMVTVLPTTSPRLSLKRRGLASRPTLSHLSEGRGFSRAVQPPPFPRLQPLRALWFPE